MKSQEYLTTLLKDLTSVVGLYSEQDSNTIRSRTAAEGQSFLEITLPTLDNFLLEGLSSGRLPDFPGWRRRRHSRLPSFMYNMWRRIFCDDGVLLPTVDNYCVLVIRQISRTFKKVFEVCSDDRVSLAVQGFKDLDRNLHFEDDVELSVISDVAQVLYSSRIIGPTVASDPVFKHGPGATADRYDSVERWSFPTIPESLESLVGAETFRATWEDLLVRPPAIEETPARLTSVPKTAEKPRLISIEPASRMFIQQGYMTLLYDHMRSFPVINIYNQERNKQLAKRASKTGDLSTIDLSEASDRIHMDLVTRIFSWNPTFVRILEKTRSTHIQTIDGEVIRLNKFASMGSALTFPVQTLVFFAILAYARCKEERNFSRSFIKNLMYDERLGVYGDDIICPTSTAQSLKDLLHKYGLKVNTLKSYSSGFFRESCGGDYYRGYNVTPIYVRRNPPTSRRDVDSLLSWSAMRDQIVENYPWATNTLDAIDNCIQRFVHYPTVPEPSRVQGIARRGSIDSHRARRDSDLQVTMVKMAVPCQERKRSTAGSNAKLFKSLAEDFNEDPQHLTHHGRPISAKLRYRWVSVG